MEVKSLKTIVSGLGVIIVFILNLLIHNSIINLTSRATELNLAINNAMVETQRVLYDKSYTITNSEEYLAEFTQNLVQYMNSNSDITIKVYSADEELGFLDVGVISSYTNFAGEKREYEERRTSIVDEISNKDFNEDYLKDRFFISFQVKNDVKVDLSGIDFFVAKDSKNKSLEIPLTSGTVHSILFNGEGVGSYSFITKEGKNYIVIQLNELNSDMEITIQ